jgi:OOP family OmpA-OmpF porin
MKQTCVCVAAIGMALAGDAAGDDSGLYVSAGLGQAEMRDETWLGGRPIVVDEDKNNLSWALGLGYRLNPYIAIDLGYADLGELEADLATPDPTENTGGRQSIAVEGATLALVGMVPIGRWEPYVKAGMLFTTRTSRFDGEIFGYPVSHRSKDDSEDPFYGAGLRYRVAEPLKIYLDVTYFDEVGRTWSSSSYLNTSAGVLWQF